MATGARFVLPYQTVIDGTGVPIPGALLTFYISGTTTPLATYSDAALSVPNKNPVPADAAGMFPNIFLLPVPYRVVLTDAIGDEIWTADPVENTQGGGNLFLLSNYGSLTAADTAAFAAHGMLIIDINALLTASYIVRSNTSFAGGIISTGAFNLTFSGDIFSAQPVRIFNISGGGNIVAGNSGLCTQVYFEWFGALGDGATDDLPAATAAWKFAASAGATVVPLSKTYYFNGTLSNTGVANSASIIAQIPNRTFCTFKGNGVATILNLVQASGFENGNYVSNIRFLNAPLGIECNGMCGVNYDNCRFDTTAGILLHNKSAGQFTEDNVITQAQFTGTGIDLEYRVTAGNNSFQGSGFGQGAQRNTSVTPASKTCIQITSASAVVYNAPCQLHVNNQSGGWVINMVSNLSTNAVDFMGAFTAEVGGGGSVTVVDTAHNPIYFDGPVHSLTSTGLIYGKLILARCFMRTASNNLLEDVFVTKQSVIVPGAATFVLPELYTDARRVCLGLFQGGAYDQMYIIDVLKNDLGAGGGFNTALHISNDDTGAYGATTIAVDASGALSITNANFPVNSVTAYFTVKGYGLAFA